MRRHDRRNPGLGVVDLLGRPAVMAGKDHQDDGRALDPEDAGIVRDPGLPVPGLVRDLDVGPQVAREAVVDLLALEDRHHQRRRLGRHELTLRHQREQPAGLARGAAAEEQPGLLDDLAERLADRGVAVLRERELHGAIAARVSV